MFSNIVAIVVTLKRLKSNNIFKRVLTARQELTKTKRVYEFSNHVSFKQVFHTASKFALLEDEDTDSKNADEVETVKEQT